jgi:hypothetical protein
MPAVVIIGQKRRPVLYRKILNTQHISGVLSVATAEGGLALLMMGGGGYQPASSGAGRACRGSFSADAVRNCGRWPR